VFRTKNMLPAGGRCGKTKPYPERPFDIPSAAGPAGATVEVKMIGVGFVVPWPECYVEEAAGAVVQFPQEQAFWARTAPMPSDGDAATIFHCDAADVDRLGRRVPAARAALATVKIAAGIGAEMFQLDRRGSEDPLGRRQEHVPLPERERNRGGTGEDQGCADPYPHSIDPHGTTKSAAFAGRAIRHELRQPASLPEHLVAQSWIPRQSRQLEARQPPGRFGNRQRRPRIETVRQLPGLPMPCDRREGRCDDDQEDDNPLRYLYSTSNSR
jgi:hypothetical protein